MRQWLAQRQLQHTLQYTLQHTSSKCNIHKVTATHTVTHTTTHTATHSATHTATHNAATCTKSALTVEIYFSPRRIAPMARAIPIGVFPQKCPRERNTKQQLEHFPQMSPTKEVGLFLQMSLTQNRPTTPSRSTTVTIKRYNTTCCNTLPRTATRCNALQHTATHYNKEMSPTTPSRSTAANVPVYWNAL